MSYVLISKVSRVAHKHHRCIWCGQGIAIGDRYTYERSVYAGDPQSNHWHPECETAAADECSDCHGCEFEFSPYDNERPTKETPNAAP